MRQRIPAKEDGSNGCAYVRGAAAAASKSRVATERAFDKRHLLERRRLYEPCDIASQRA
jgi:hypothetical protein